SRHLRSPSVRRDPSRPGIVSAATVGGLHRSSDGGETWTRVSRESLVVTALEVDRRTGRLYVGTEGEGVFFSDDGGATLANGSVGLAAGRVTDLLAGPSHPARAFFFPAYRGGAASGKLGGCACGACRAIRCRCPPRSPWPATKPATRCSCSRRPRA